MYAFYAGFCLLRILTLVPLAHALMYVVEVAVEVVVVGGSYSSVPPPVDYPRIPSCTTVSTNHIPYISGFHRSQHLYCTSSTIV